MSIQSLPPRIHTRLGRCALALLIGAVLTLSGLLPSVAFAHTQGQASVLASDPNYLVDKAGVSVVRLAVTYRDSNNPQAKEVTCTGLGVLVGSVPVSPNGPFHSWVLTDANLLSSAITTCELANADTETIQILANNSYTQNSAVLVTLGQLSCSLGGNPLAVCEDEGTTRSEMFVPVANKYALISFQTTAEQPYLSVASTASPSPTVLGLTNAQKQAFTTIKVGSTSTNVLQSYLTPTVVATDQSAGNPATNAQNNPTTASGLPNGIEPGEPQVDAGGKLVAMYASDGTFAPLSTFAVVASTVIGPVSQNSLAVLWDQGMDAYNQGTQSSCQQAHSDFQKIGQITPANTNFKAASVFAARAQTCAQPTSSVTPKPAQSNTLSLPLLIGLVAALVILLVLLVMATLWVGRANKRRRDLAQFEAELAEGQRQAEAKLRHQAEEELQRQNAYAQGRQIPCPNCRQPVRTSDPMCPSCRYPLSPSASGLNVRLVGSSPLPPQAAPLAPPPPPPQQVKNPVNASSVSEMPTLHLAPEFAAGSPTAGGERTMKRQKSRQPQEATSAGQPAKTRNLSLAVGTRSDPGLKRKHKPNEDSLLAMQWARTHNSQQQQLGLFVVADGMGGHANGQDASRTAIQTIVDYLLPKVVSSEVSDEEVCKQLLSDGVQHANMAVHNRNLEAHADMGTTMTAALVVGSTAYVANVGDSRTYRYTKNEGLAKVTMDHSVVASLVEAGIIQPDDIYTHPKRNQIYRSLGEKPVVEVDTFKVDVQSGDKLLLCSDGLWDMVRDPVIQEVISKPTNDPNKTGQDLIKAALQGGGEDNVTVIVVQFSELNTHTGMTGIHLHAKPDSVTVPNLPPL